MCLLGPEFDQTLSPALITVHVEAYSEVGELLEVGGQQKSDWVWGMAWNKGRLRLGVVRWGRAPLCHRIHVSPHSNIITHCLLPQSSPLNQWAASSSSWFQGLWSSIPPVNSNGPKNASISKCWRDTKNISLKITIVEIWHTKCWIFFFKESLLSNYQKLYHLYLD